MIPVGKFVLSVMNSSIDLIMPELKKLGLLNSNKFLNTEYVTRLTNVTEYDRNMIVFHGVNEFFTEKSKIRRTTRRVSKEVPYSKPTLNELVLKLRPVFNQHEFEVFGPTQAKSTSEVDYNKALSTPFGISFSPSDTETKTLKSWLQQAKNSKNIFVRDIKNKKIGWNHEIYRETANKINEQDEFIKNPFEVVEGVLECKCGSKKVYSYQKQCRGADEPMTTFAQCVKCNAKWRYSG
jgi:DNA-directed RNA polymerase subunit M/transcription elongation factor TFIIS